MRGDFPRLLSLVRQVRTDLASKREYHLIQMVELCECGIYAGLGQKDKIPAGLFDGGPGSIRVWSPAVPTFNIIYGRVLLINGEYLKLIGSAGHFLSLASVFPNLLGQIYTYIYLAAAHRKIFRTADALASLRQALAIAAPDQMYMPFVENCDYIEPLLERLAAEESYQEAITAILALYKTYRRSKEQIIREYFTGTKPGLTKREIEVARLAAAGITNDEIGKQLYISSNTVKKVLKSVFAKLSIGNRTLLTQRLADLAM
jgi:LuxR family maltose regulon positive regulatory protein